MDVGADENTLAIQAQDGDEAELEVFDFYDRAYNTVVAGNGVVLKRPTPHGSGRVPVVIVPVGPVPMVQTDSAADSVSDYGESVFKSNREIYDKHNLMMSIFLELAARARKPPLGVKSRDGRKTLEEDPYREGTTISMSEGDEVEAFPLLQTTQDAADLTGQISGEVQRGSIPHSVYGELQFQLSGFAINTLRSGLDSVLRPRLIAEGSFYAQGLELLTEQYVSGRFSPLRAWVGGSFDAAMTPDAISRGGTPEIRLEGKLPEDDTAKYAQARMAREGEVPLLPDRWIYDNILKIRDADNIEQAVSAQVARRGTPESLMLNSMIASAPTRATTTTRGCTRANCAWRGCGSCWSCRRSERRPPARGTARHGRSSEDGPGLPPQVLPEAFVRSAGPSLLRADGWGAAGGVGACGAGWVR